MRQLFSYKNKVTMRSYVHSDESHRGHTGQLLQVLKIPNKKELMHSKKKEKDYESLPKKEPIGVINSSVKK